MSRCPTGGRSDMAFPRPAFHDMIHLHVESEMEIVTQIAF
jgi:hypothetical protein